MALRPVFIPELQSGSLVKVHHIEFTWHPGFSTPQKRRSISELHKAACAQISACRTLEISTKSENPLGVRLSAFNLTFKTKTRSLVLTVETAFQGSKVFENGGPFTDLYGTDSRSAKKDGRIRTSGRLVKFRFCGDEWPTEPKTAFFDWLYINALLKHDDLVNGLAD